MAKKSFRVMSSGIRIDNNPETSTLLPHVQRKIDAMCDEVMDLLSDRIEEEDFDVSQQLSIGVSVASTIYMQVLARAMKMLKNPFDMIEGHNAITETLITKAKELENDEDESPRNIH